jgi:FHA domain
MSGGNDDRTRILGSDDEATRILGGQRSAFSSRSQGGGTLIGVANLQDDVRVGGQDASQPAEGNTMFLPDQASAGATAFDPVVAWLVVKSGPGRGESRNVHYGQNSIGRGRDQRISLDFGDARISREAHAFLIYDDQQRKFYLRDNGKSNVVRHKGCLVMVPTEILDRDEITIGETTLTFVALCDSRFDWLADHEQNKT